MIRLVFAFPVSFFHNGSLRLYTTRQSPRSTRLGEIRLRPYKQSECCPQYMGLWPLSGLLKR
jgi:hypothetical protein